MANENPGLLPELIRQRDELFPRFAAYYRQLKALPRRLRRRLQRQWHLPLAGIALMLALGQSPALAATIPVNASCSLIDAITAANTDTAIGGCPAGAGADTILLPAGSTQTLTAVNNSAYGPTGLPVISSVITIAGQGSTIARDSAAPAFRIMAVNSTGDLTLQETTISGGSGGIVNFGGTLTVLDSIISSNSSFAGGGVENLYGTLTVTNSTISGNSASHGGGMANFGTLTIINSTISSNFASAAGGGVSNSGGTLTITNSVISSNSTSYLTGQGGGGVANFGTLTITNSTISGNSTRSEGGGVANHLGGSTLTISNSTISGNSALFFGGGVANSESTLILTRTLVSGNSAPTGPEVFKNVPYGGIVVADNHNIFGVNGNAGVVNFTPGPTDIVPPVGVQLSSILNPVLAFNGGPTQTHALVPGSPAIDAGGIACTDASGNPLLTDQRGRPRIIDGNSDGTARCDIGAFEFFPVVNNLVALDPALDTSFDPTPVPHAPAGTFTIGATFTNTSGTPLRFPFFTVTGLSGSNLLLNADEGARGVGATVTPDVGEQLLSPGETVQVDFIIGLQTRSPFTFFVDLFGEPLVSGSPTSGRRPKMATKAGRR
jgi:hypothetical protein